VDRVLGFSLFYGESSTYHGDPTEPGVPAHILSSMGYIAPQRTEESGLVFKRRVHATLKDVAKSEKKAPRMRIMTLQPTVEWSVMWNNFGPISCPTEFDRCGTG
jgi:hypothetical protein